MPPAPGRRPARGRPRRPPQIPATAAPVRAPAAALVLAETPRVHIDTPSLQGSINLKGAQIDDLVLVAASASRSPRIRRRCACCRRSARPAPISPSSAGPAMARQPPASTRSGPPTGQTLAPGKPVTLSTTEARRHALPADHCGRRRLSVHRQAGCANASAQADRAAPDRASSAARPNRSTRRAGRCTSAR